jgi:DNA/RNA-binding domain of Phe-tRNA-synthetase-like protein
MKKILIDDKLFDLFPDMQIGIVHLKGLDNSINQESGIYLRESEKQVRKKWSGHSVLEMPEIADWRKAYKTLGVKKGTRVSLESLLKRVLKENEIPSINPLVDYYNATSLQNIFPCGGEDLDQTKGDIRLTFAKGSESFKQIGSDVDEPPEIDEVIYKDDLGCLCRRWNWREADRTKLTEETKNAILVVESLNTNRVEEITEALEKLALLCERKLNAKTAIKVLNKETPAMII